jgi:heat shock protein HslJ
MPFPATATVRVAEAVYEGCAGEAVDLLLGAPWIVEELDGEPVTEGSVPVTIAFGADGTTAGDTGCNGYTGAYALSGEGVTVSQLASTLRACPPPAMEHEAAFLELLASVSRFAITDAGALRLQAWDGRTMLARR